MSERTGIEWTDATFSPWRGCDRVSPGCAHCYAALLAEKYWPKEKLWDKGSVRRIAAASSWTKVLGWNRKAEREGVRRRVFPSILDLFEDRQELIEPRRWYWGLTKATPWLDHLVLTKRAECIERMLPDDWGDGYPNVWLGVSVENQEWADKRIPYLLATPAAVRFISAEPLLGPINLDGYLRPTQTLHLRADIEGMLRNRQFDHLQDEDGLPLSRREAEEKLWGLYREGVRFIRCGKCDTFDPASGCPGHRNPALDWVIVGGESGPGHRPMDPAWAVSIREQCAAAGVPYFFKQTGGPRPGMGTLPDGTTPREWPAVRTA